MRRQGPLTPFKKSGIEGVERDRVVETEPFCVYVFKMEKKSVSFNVNVKDPQEKGSKYTGQNMLF